MKAAIIGSRGMTVHNFDDYLPEDVDEIVSGGARGIDTCAKEYAKRNHIKYTEFLPDYAQHGKKAPLLRNIEIIRYSDIVFAFWDGVSRGTKFVIDRCRAMQKPVFIISVDGTVRHEDNRLQISLD